MAYSPVPVESFGGLNLIDDPGTVGWGGAVDLLDVEPDLGSIRSRDQFTTHVANTTLSSPILLTWPGQDYLVASGAASLKLYDNTFAAPVTIATPAAPAKFYSAQAFGTSSTSYLYLADGTATNAVRRLTTAGAISAPAGMPTCKYLSRTSWENRMVAGHISGSPHRVQFSAAGDAETWGVNDYVDLDPGDGEAITALAAWRDLLFVFKKTKFYVFYGTSIDSTGNPIFNYRAVRAGVGAFDRNSGATGSGTNQFATANTDGVYFFCDGRGVYRTVGGEPVLVSGAIDHMFQGYYHPFFAYGIVNRVWDMTAVGGRVYIKASWTASGGGSSGGTLVYIPDRNFWTVFAPTGGSMVARTADAVPRGWLAVASATANASIDILSPFATSDSVATPTPRYRSGFSDLGSTQRKRVREWILEGSGTPTLKTSVDFGSLETGAAVTLGTSPAVAEGRRRYATRGRQFSWQVSASGAFSINNLVAHVDEKRVPGVHA